MKLIIYGSQYGTAKRYAEELAGKTGIEAKSFKEVADISCYDTLIYIGALYAGGVLGMKKTFAGMSQYQDKEIIIATVGLADPMDAENVSNIKNSIKRQLPTKLYENARIFHLRGGIDYFSHLYDEGRIFPLTKHILYREMLRGSSAGGVKKIRVHDLRHSHASLLIELGFSPLLIAERLGHENIETTLNRYSHLYPHKQGELAQMLDSMQKP